MGYREMRKPLLQSAVVLLAVLLIIGFVAGSGADSIFGGVFSIFKGILYTILFAFALVIALIISVVLLIAVLLGGVALYSPDSARDMFFRLRKRATMVFSSWNDILEPTSVSAEDQDAPRKEENSSSPIASEQNTQTDHSAEFSELRRQIERLNEVSESTTVSLTTVQDNLAAIPVAEIVRRTEQMEAYQEELKSKLDQCLEKLEQVQARAESGLKNAESQGKEISATRDELRNLSSGLAELRTDLRQVQESGQKIESSMSIDEEKYRIFTYLDQAEDKNLFAELIAKAVEENMTYAEIDAFLTKKLPAKLDSIIKDHPSLTKEYIRDCRSD